jgi:hypothetical protein
MRRGRRRDRRSEAMNRVRPLAFAPHGCSRFCWAADAHCQTHGDRRNCFDPFGYNSIEELAGDCVHGLVFKKEAWDR